MNTLNKTAMCVAVVIMMVLSSCGHHHDHDAAHAHEHDENLQLTAYCDDFEVFAEASPFVAGEASDILAHFTFLDNFKPLLDAKVTATLTIGPEQSTQTLETHYKPGIYKFSLTPKTVGIGNLQFLIERDGKQYILEVSDITVYSDAHEAQHAAADAAVSSSNGVVFTKEQSWNMEFSTEPVRSDPFGTVVKTVARILPAPDDEQRLTAKADGIVLFGGDIAEGNAVNAGQCLFTIESGSMADNNLGVRSAQVTAEYNHAKAEYERKQELAQSRIISESELQQAKAAYELAKADYDNLHSHFSGGKVGVSATKAGFVKQLLVHNGEFVKAGQTLAVITQNQHLYLRAEVSPKYYNALQNISTAHFKVLNSGQVYSLDSLRGSVVSYGKSVDEESSMLPVIFQVDNAAGLLPGSFVETYIKTRNEKNALTVPNIALIEEMGNYFVYVQLTPEFFEKRQVHIGSTDGIRTEILSGVKASDRVVAKGAILVKLKQASGGLDAHSGHVH